MKTPYIFSTRKKYEFSLWAVREINDQDIQGNQTQSLTNTHLEKELHILYL